VAAGRKSPQSKTPSTDKEPKSDLEELSALLMFVNRISERLQEAAATAELDLAIPDWLLLRAIKDDASSSMAEIARKIGVTRQRVHQQVTRLETAKLITSTSTEGTKSKQVSLSSTGAQLLDRAESAILGALSHGGEVPSKHIHGARRNVMKILKALQPKQPRDKKQGEDSDKSA
jgi:DNA-binding MarR family transcriptional regulator